MHSLLVLVKEVQSLLNLCRPKETSSLEEVLRPPAGPLMAADDRPGVENFTPDVLPTFSEALQPQNNEHEKGKKKECAEKYRKFFYLRTRIKAAAAT